MNGKTNLVGTQSEECGGVFDPSGCPVGDCMKKGGGDYKCRTSCRDHVLSKRDLGGWDVGSERIPTLWGVHGRLRFGTYG